MILSNIATNFVPRIVPNDTFKDGDGAVELGLYPGLMFTNPNGYAPTLFIKFQGLNPRNPGSNSAIGWYTKFRASTQPKDYDDPARYNNPLGLEIGKGGTNVFSLGDNDLSLQTSFSIGYDVAAGIGQFVEGEVSGLEFFLPIGILMGPLTVGLSTGLRFKNDTAINIGMDMSLVSFRGLGIKDEDHAAYAAMQIFRFFISASFQ